MINLNPLTLGLVASAASGVIAAVPKAQLARLGLVRLPLVAPAAFAPLPAAAAATGGALAVALLVPSSRRWIFSQANLVSSKVREKLLSNGKADETSSESASASETDEKDDAHRRPKPHRVKESPQRKASVA